MSHAHHFLSRLDRVSLPHLELALGLYNDPARLQFLLHDAGLPAHAERVAVSLEHPVRGPFLVVTRDGRFVTCLGEGMSTGDLPILSRAALDGAGVRFAKLREQADVLRRAAPTEGAARALLGRIYDLGDELPREEFTPISALSPLYAGQFLALMLESAKVLRSARALLFPELRRADRFKPMFRDALRAYWQTLWASAHLGVLGALEGPRLLESFPDSGRAAFLKLGFWTLTQQGLVGPALRGAWAVARVGKPLLGTYKRRYAEATTLPGVIDGGIGLLALGAAHASMRAEVRKALVAGAAITGSSSPMAGPLKALTSSLVTLADASPEDTRDHARAQGRAWAALIARATPGDVARRFAHPQDVPDTIATSVMANLPIPYPVKGNGMNALLSCVPWAARAAPEELYLPREWIRLVHVPWTPAHTESVLVPLREHFQTPRAPPPSRDEPTRNGPCPCKSGKKYKRCCGEAAGVT